MQHTLDETPTECQVGPLAWDRDEISRALMNTKRAHNLFAQNNEND
jgi:hypothetical protein